ncbi:MAG: AI-2E family transporter, partial [Deltaproteobacteria bacterium]
MKEPGPEQERQPETAELQGAPTSAEATRPPGPCGPPPENQGGFPSRFGRIFFGAVTILVLYFSYLIIKPYLLDIFMALVLFFTAKPLYLALNRLLKGWKVIASFLTCLILLLIILIPLFSLMSIIATQALEFSSQVSRGMQSGHLWQWITVKIDVLKHYLTHLNLPVPPGDIKLEHIVQTVVSKASAFVYENAIGLIKGFSFFFFDLVLVLFITFFLFLQGDEFIAAVKRLSPLDPSHNDEILREMETTIKATLWGTVIVAFAQGTLGGVGFLIFGLPQPAFWGTVMIPASVIPVVGSSIIWGPAAIYLLFTGRAMAGIGLILWGGVVVSVIDNILKPILVKGSSETPSILILFSILGGLTYFGIIGFILGPLILSVLLLLLRIYQKTLLAPAPLTAAP